MLLEFLLGLPVLRYMSNPVQNVPRYYLLLLFRYCLSHFLLVGQYWIWSCSGRNRRIDLVLLADQDYVQMCIQTNFHQKWMQHMWSPGYHNHHHNLHNRYMFRCLLYNLILYWKIHTVHLLCSLLHRCTDESRYLLMLH